MQNGRLRLPLALLACIVWLALTIGVAHAIRPGGKTLMDMVSGGIGWQFVSAAGFLLLLSSLLGWTDLRLAPPRPARKWALLWFPALSVLFFLATALLLGPPPPAMAAWVALNTLLVGLSEELMFRGVLFRALLGRFRLWPSVWITSILFGAVHSLNVFLTGELGPALVQSVTAFMSGTLFIGIVLSTGSLLPAILYHGLWDFATFALIAAGNPAPGEDAAHQWLQALPGLLVLPNFLYGLYLLRRAARPA